MLRLLNRISPTNLQTYQNLSHFGKKKNKKFWAQPKKLLARKLLLHLKEVKSQLTLMGRLEPFQLRLLKVRIL